MFVRAFLLVIIIIIRHGRLMQVKQSHHMNKTKELYALLKHELNKQHVTEVLTNKSTSVVYIL